MSTRAKWRQQVYNRLFWSWSAVLCHWLPVWTGRDCVTGNSQISNQLGNSRPTFWGDFNVSLRGYSAQLRSRRRPGSCNSSCQWWSRLRTPWRLWAQPLTSMAKAELNQTDWTTLFKDFCNSTSVFLQLHFAFAMRLNQPPLTKMG